MTPATVFAQSPTCRGGPSVCGTGCYMPSIVEHEDPVYIGPAPAVGPCPQGNLLTNTGVLGANGNLTYTPLEPIPGAPSQPNFCQLLNLLFKVLIYLGGMVAVLFLVLGGITYMVSEVVDKRSQAKQRIKAAVWGLLLLLMTWIILNTVNPALLSCQILNPAPAVGVHPIVSGNAGKTDAQICLEAFGGGYYYQSRADGSAITCPTAPAGRALDGCLPGPGNPQNQNKTGSGNACCTQMGNAVCTSKTTATSIDPSLCTFSTCPLRSIRNLF